jgi:3-oxoacyl-[acyl-carrier-protein] synthase II
MHTECAVVISGAAVLTPLADTLERLGSRLREGQCALPASLLPAITIADFDASRYAAVRGMRVYNRTTQLAICAVKRALDDAQLSTEGAAGERVGLLMAASFGHLDTLIAYDRSLVTQGLARTNPVLMPLALASAPGAATALGFNVKAFSATLSNGSAGALDAIGLGARLLAAGRADACLVVSAFSPCAELTLAASRAGLLANSAPRAFDRRRQGLVFGEAAAALVLERAECCAARGARPLGLVRGQASAFAALPEQGAAHLGRAARDALRSAGLAAGEIALASSGASGSLSGDRAEAGALLGLLLEARATAREQSREAPSGPRVAAIKANLGDALDASGLLQTLLALDALRAGAAPAIVGLEEPELPGLDYQTDTAPLTGSHALISAIAHNGACSALVVSAA